MIITTRTQQRRMMKVTAVLIATLLFNACLVGGAVWVAIHFIRKFW